MLRLKRYLTPFIFSVIAVVALLFFEAITELILPNYMSDIVNTGIQQNGITNCSPEALSENAYNFVTAFMSDGEITLFEENYLKVSPADKNSDGKTYISVYPKASEPIYILKEVNEETRNKLDNAFAVASMTFFNTAKEIISKNDDSSQNQTEIDLSIIYQALPLIAQIPAETISTQHDTAILADESTLKQVGVMFTNAFYNELGVDLHKIQSGYIMKTGMVMLLIAFASGVAAIVISLLQSRIAAGVARNLRRDAFNKIETFSHTEFDKFSTASLITRCTNDVSQLQMFLSMGIRMLCFAPIMGIGSIIMAVNKAPSMTWILVLAVIILLALIFTIVTVAMPKFKIIQKLIDRLNLVSREGLSGLMVIRAFGTDNHEKVRFDKANTDLTSTNLFINRTMAFAMPAMSLIMNGATLLVVWVGAHEIANTSLQVGDMMAFMQYAMHVIMSFLFITMMLIFIPRASVSAVRIAEILETEAVIIDPATPTSFDSSKKGCVELKNVSYRYHGAEEDAVHNVSFTVNPGETTAIIGSTGSGKSTLANLIMRFYDVTNGEILVDGVDVRKVRQKDLRNKIGYVPQKGVLISGTIESNIKYGNQTLTDDEMHKVAEISQSLEFISAKPDTFADEISQGGTNVSGGQKQRLSIARALAKKPEILIFDDSFSALDFKTDFALRKALKQHTADTTIIVVAQRVGTIKNAEQIIVMDEGVMVGIGTHKELLKSCSQYYEIASSQLSKEELE